MTENRTHIDDDWGKAEPLMKAFDGAALQGQLRDEALDILHECDAGRFASGAVNDQDKTRLTTRARDLFTKLDRIAR